ncbi:MAG TPA: hypothetical protein VK171_07935 [Fimbriimonas sp.]|nr:hypothetical protein [Fimbriimonas sp.]
MRLWASSSSITFDELIPQLGQVAEIALSLDIIDISGTSSSDDGWPFSLKALGQKALVQIPSLERTFTAATGILQNEATDTLFWNLESVFTVSLGMGTRDALNGFLKDHEIGQDCEVLGGLWLAGRESFATGKTYLPARILRFESLCLISSDPRFGTWFEVDRYGDLGSDPDVIAASVCVAEIELL